MGDIISELFPLDLSLSEIVKTTYRAGELNYRGVGVLLLNSRADLHKLQKTEKDLKRMHPGDRKPDTLTILGNYLVFTDVVPPGKFVSLSVEHGLRPEPEEKKKEE